LVAINTEHPRNSSSRPLSVDPPTRSSKVTLPSTLRIERCRPDVLSEVQSESSLPLDMFDCSGRDLGLRD